MERLHFVNAGIVGGSLHFGSAIKERVLVLRGNSIAITESLGATEEQFITIVMSHNEIAKLEKLSYISRLGTLLINIKRITYIRFNLGDELKDNLITSLVDIEPFVYLPKLQFLSLVDNAVTKRPNYRLSVIQKLQHLSLLDFEKVKQRERAEAAPKFHSKEATKKVAAKAHTPAVVDAQGTTKEMRPKVVSLMPAQSTPIKEETGATRMFHSKETEEEEKVTSKACAVLVMDVQYTRREQEGSRVVSSRSAHFTTVKEIFGADLDCICATLKDQVETYIYKNFERAPFNFILFSWRKRFFLDMHILPPPRRQEPASFSFKNENLVGKVYLAG